MKKSILVISLLGVGLFISSCGGSGTSNSSVNSESNSITSVEDSISSENNSELDSTTSENNSELESITSEVEEISSSENNSSEEISSVQQLTVKEQLEQYLSYCIETANYTIVNEELTRYYVPNAFYCEDNYASPYGYAEDDEGIFSYSISNSIVESVNYMKDDNGENLKGLYSYSYGNYSWIDKENYLINSFDSISKDDIKLTRVKNTKVETYSVDFNVVYPLLAEFHLQNFVAASVSGGVVTKSLRGTCNLTITDNGFNMSFYSSATYTTIDYEVVNIGTTEIPAITYYIENDGAQMENLYTQIVSLFYNDKYKITYSDGIVRYVTPSYVVTINGDTINGYFISLSDLLTYPFTVENGEVVVGEALETGLYGYYIRPGIFSSFELNEDKLTNDSYLSLQGTANCFTTLELTEGNLIGKAEISASIVKDENNAIVPSDCVVTFVGTEYDGNQGKLLETTYTAQYSEFGSASYEIIENYLSSIN